MFVETCCSNGLFMDLLTGGGWFKYCWFKDCWARSLFTAYCWFSNWAITSCWFTSWGLMGVDTSPGCRFGSGVRTDGWLPWESWTGDGGCSAVFPGTGCWPKLTWLAPCWDSSERLSISTMVGKKHWKSQHKTDNHKLHAPCKTCYLPSKFIYK